MAEGAGPFGGRALGTRTGGTGPWDGRGQNKIMKSPFRSVSTKAAATCSPESHRLATAAVQLFEPGADPRTAATPKDTAKSPKSIGRLHRTIGATQGSELGPESGMVNSAANRLSGAETTRLAGAIRLKTRLVMPPPSPLRRRDWPGGDWPGGGCAGGGGTAGGCAGGWSATGCAGGDPMCPVFGC
jgi:hypothetical protein